MKKLKRWKSEKSPSPFWMARTNQTARRAVPSHDDVAAALVVASVPMAHVLAPPTPPLSAARSKFAIDWVMDTYGCHFFVEPVDWRSMGLLDYPTQIAHPMDLGTLKCYGDAENFCFATMLDRSRVIWANACLYNGDSHPVSEVARRVASVFEAKIVEMQQHPEDDSPQTVTQVIGPLLCAMIAEEGTDVFYEPVDISYNPSYPTVVQHGMCLKHVEEQLNKITYVSRYDAAADLWLIFDNAIAFNGLQSMYGVSAKFMKDMFQQLFDARSSDVDSQFFVTNQMRTILHDNLINLHKANRLVVMQMMRDQTFLSIQDTGGETIISIDKMCLSEFVRTDTLVRKLLVNQDGEEEEEGEGEGEEWEDGESDCESAW